MDGLSDVYLSDSGLRGLLFSDAELSGDEHEEDESAVARGWGLESLDRCALCFFGLGFMSLSSTTQTLNRKLPHLLAKIL